ncbi:MAG: hypothetical protein AAB443_04375 [Patescibacteria group bacterium]
MPNIKNKIYAAARGPMDMVSFYAGVMVGIGFTIISIVIYKAGILIYIAGQSGEGLTLSTFVNSYIQSALAFWNFVVVMELVRLGWMVVP